MKCAKYDVIIVGGGASGLACAVTLARGGKKLKVAIFEAGERLGKKLASTGNGQGNVTNNNLSIDRYFGSCRELVQNIALSPRYKCVERELFHCILAADGEGRVYPCGRQASSLCDSMIGDIKSAGYDYFVGSKVTQIERGFTVALENGDKFQSDYLLLSCGGKAQSKTGGFSYGLVNKFGHEITPLYPSLVQLRTPVDHIRTLKGIRTDCAVRAYCADKLLAERRGDVIFTDYGVSGNAVFAVSPFVTGRNNAVLSLEFLPDIDINAIVSDVKAKKSLGYPRLELLSGTLHNQLGRTIIKRSGSDDPEIIACLVKDFRLEVTGTLNFDYAQVTKGGIAADGIKPNLESKFAKNLYFAGEILDVDGECGGYNLHWAFASGAAVAEDILKNYD